MAPIEAPWDADACSTRWSSGPGTPRALVGAGPLGRCPLAPRESPPRAPAGRSWDTTSSSGDNLAPIPPRRSCGHPVCHTEPGDRGRRIGLAPGRFSGQLLGALRCEPVVTAQSVLDDLLAVDADQSVQAQTVQRRIQGARAQAHTSV